MSRVDARSAEPAAREDPPDVALLDYALERGTGLDARAALEAHCGPLRCAILTGDRDPAVAAAVAARGLPLLYKPASPVRIRALLSSLVRKKL